MRYENFVCPTIKKQFNSLYTDREKLIRISGATQLIIKKQKGK